MAEEQRVWWETCAHDGCIGVRLRGGKCLAHSSRARRQWTLRELRRSRPLDVTCGVPITPALLEEILDAAPKDSQGHACLRDVTFEKATFHGWLWFGEVIFQGHALFTDATFQGYATFLGTTFQGGATFDNATFQGDATFLGPTFQGDALFKEATFQGDVAFLGTTFQGRALFDEATFQGDARFDWAIFQGDGVWFKEATFEQARRLGPMLVHRQLVFDQAVFKQRVQIEASAAMVCCRGARFQVGVQLRLRWAQVVLDDADLAAPSILTVGQPGENQVWAPKEERWARLLTVLSPPRSPRPRLLSVHRALVAGLTVSNVDLRACRFLAAYNLDKLRLEGEQLFAGPPSYWYLTRRQILAEEHHWRHGRKGTHEGNVGPAPAEQDRRDRQPTARWYAAECQPPAWLEVEPPQPGQVAELYRALRKGREDSKDEPGAADFYYGEMEMRRHTRLAAARDAWRSRRRLASDRRTWYERSPSRGLAAGVEYVILSAYWLVSGYALRAWRALAAFIVLLVLFALLLTSLGGFAPSPIPAASPSPPPTTDRPTTPSSAPTTVTRATADTSFGGALIYGARTVIGLTRDPQPRLTRWGDVLQILLRILGPVLLGLAVLSVRGRVKR